MAYGIRAVVGEPWEVVLGRVREALAEQGFEVLTALDLSEALRAGWAWSCLLRLSWG
jgi:uncharacterized protein (DUF302 family)